MAATSGDPFRFTTIGHKRHSLCSPLSEARIAALVELLELGAEDRTLDLAGGKGELSIRLSQRYGSTGVVVDRNPSFLAEGRERALARVGPEALSFVESDAADFAPASPVDLVMCIGARPFGTREETLKALRAFVRPGGELLIGEGYYRSEPPGEFLEALGEGAEEGAVRFEDHLALAQAQGLVPVHAFASTVEEFDQYDGLYRASLLRFADEHPEDPDSSSFGERARAWTDLYYRWGRELWGFGWYLYRRPSADATRGSEPSSPT